MPLARRYAVVAAVSVAAALWGAGQSSAAPGIKFGVQDDAWLRYGPGTLESRIAELERLRVGIVRFTVRWDDVATRRPLRPRDHRDPAYEWASSDTILRALRSHRIPVVLTLLGTPSWANGGRGPNWMPKVSNSFANFAHAAATRYRWVRHWTIWNEPNQPRWLRPTSAALYVQRLLNPAYAQIKATIPSALVGGGMTSPRGGISGVPPVTWLRAMAQAEAKLDAYAHHPYPSNPRHETPWGPGCKRCANISMADLDRLLAEVRQSFGPKRIWLTEYGYQTNPPDRLLGVSAAKQAQYVTSASRRAYLAPYVDMLIFFLVVDDSDANGWQSGFFTAAGVEKPSHAAFRMPVTQVARQGRRVTLWGQVRGAGTHTVRVRHLVNGRWTWASGTQRTNPDGSFTLTLTARRGTILRVWSPRIGYSMAFRAL